MNADVALALADAGYDGLFLAGDHSRSAEIYAGNRAPLDAIVDGAGDDRARILAAEVLYDQTDGPHAPAEMLAPLYARALQLTGDYVFPGNLWGMLWASAGYDGPLGAHLLAQGQAAVQPLAALLDDDSPLFYEGSKEALAGNRRQYRVKDAAAYFLGRLTGRDVPFHEAHEDRDAEIERLKADAG